ncbi:MAG: hypothetical protein GW858_14645 [Sphingomonadales bacterium]|nr:hypothetical protein [Sphingomonadales bacterium]
MVIVLLVLIVLLLLFSAAVLRGWLRNLLGALLGCILLAATMMTAVRPLGAGSFIWIWIGGGLLLLIEVLWAR